MDTSRPSQRTIAEAEEALQWTAGVRLEARRLRTKLKEYYEGPGRNDPLLIGLRPGSYVPIFRWLDVQPHKPHQEIGAAVQMVASVAVLPFVNMSPEPEQDYFCDGSSEGIINSPMHIAGLKVIARSSAFQFKGMPLDIREVGRRLNADVVLAFQRLNEAIDHKTNFVNLLAVEPFFHPLRSDRRFTRLLKRLNLPG